MAFYKVFLFFTFIILVDSYSIDEAVKSCEIKNFKGNGKVTHVKTLPVKNFQWNSLSLELNVDEEKVILNLIYSKRRVFSPHAPVWLVKSNSKSHPQYRYELVKNRKNIIKGNFYVDNKNKAVILVSYDQEKNITRYDGVFGEGSSRFTIHSSTDKFRPKRSNEINNDHMIYDSPEMKKSDFDDAGIIIESNGISLEKLETPLKILYPKILVVVDYHLFKLLKKDVTETVKYIATFWNIVDQKYTRFQSPKVKAIVTGIIIANDEKALQHVYYMQNKTKTMDIEESVENARLYFSQSFINDTNFKNYDAAFIMTGLKMDKLEGIVDTSGIVAKLGSICNRNYSTAIITDDGAYSNTLTAIHELGHLLNLYHDYADECYGYSYLFGPIKTSVMSTPSNGIEIFWSDCSKRQLKQFASLRVSKCLKKRQRID